MKPTPKPVGRGDAMTQKKQTQSKRDWIVRMEVKMFQDVYVEHCTEAGARDNPFAHAIEERQLDTIDRKVMQVQPNE